jgi:predicted secreted protein
MATSAIAGFNARVSISVDGGTSYQLIGEARDATLNISQNEIEATSFDSVGWSEYIPGLKEWSVDIEALYIPTNVAQENLFEALVDGTTLKIKLLPKTGVGNTGYQGSVFITSWEINPTPDDAVAVAVSFRGTGELDTFTAA